MLEYKVELTPCYPNCWYGGPYWNNVRMTNQTGYFFPTEQLAREYVEKLK